jgi:23S rRNA U2552 (ribose-2'-O)-methylase RlmE/FtsJ
MTKALSKGSAGSTAKHGRGLTVRTRAAILKAMDLVDTDTTGKYTPVHELLAVAAQKDIFKFMDTASKYIIKDMNTDMDGNKSLDSLTNEELADIVASHARKQREQLEQEQKEQGLAMVETQVSTTST